METIPTSDSNHLASSLAGEEWTEIGRYDLKGQPGATYHLALLWDKNQQFRVVEFFEDIPEKKLIKSLSARQALDWMYTYDPGKTQQELAAIFSAPDLKDYIHQKATGQTKEQEQRMSLMTETQSKIQAQVAVFSEGRTGIADLLSTVYPLVGDRDVTGQERVIVSLSREDFEQAVKKAPYAHHIVLADKSELSVDDGIALARKGASAVVQHDDHNELLSVVAASLHEKKNIGFYINMEPSLKPVVTGEQHGRLQLEGFKNNYLVGTSEPMRKLLNELSTATYYDGMDILVLGENGTGKELVTKTLLDNTKRKSSVVLNAGSMSDELFESLLMGYKKGAFTGANHDTDGYLKTYDKGVIVLDEIGDLSLHKQSVLLRVIQNREGVRLGPGEKPYNFDIQFVFATNKNLDQLVREKKFRLDLYNRLKKQMIVIPPLRDRKEDVALIATNFIGVLNERYPRQQKQIEEATMDMLKELQWPGNVRELEHVLVRCHKEAGTHITPQLLVRTISAEKYVPQQRVKQNHEVIEDIARKFTIPS